MIEPFLECRSIDLVPAARVMTIRALLAHVALVIVLVTIHATRKSHVDVLDVRLSTTSTDRFVTLFARYVAVQVGQAIPGLVMIESHHFIPGGLTVTVLAGLVGELPGMRVVGLVTSQARGSYTQERRLRGVVFACISDDIWGNDQLGSVALPTAELGMTPAELEAGAVVAKCGGIESDHVEVETEVILVAIGAILLGDRRVKPLLLPHAVAQRHVALETLVIQKAAAPESVATRTVSDTAQLSMSLSQFPRGNELRSREFRSKHHETPQ
ncbi:MAG: hypothetical protein OEZ42_15010 [Gemmatimonadota bacterium]|nr:hypothetical protein [Gemmatimonadota bacterium]